MISPHYLIHRETATLSNGIRIVLFRRPGSPVYMEAIANAGSRFNKDRDTGEAHFLEHWLLAGTESFPTKDRMARYIEEFGGWAGGHTSPSFLKVNIMLGDAAYFDKAAFLLGEILGKPHLDDTTFTTERGSILQEIRSRRAKPASYIEVPWRRCIFAGSTLEKDTLGDPEKLTRLTPDELRAFHRKCFLSEGLLILMAGDIGIDEAAKSLEKEIGNLSLSPAMKEPVSTFSDRNRIMAEETEAHGNLSLRIGFRFSDKSAEEKAVANLIRTVLAGGRGSRLIQKLRYKQGLIYSIHGNCPSNPGSAVFHVDTECASNSAAEVVGIIRDELNNVRHNGLDEDEISFAKAKTINSVPVSIQNINQLVELARFTEQHRHHPFDFSEYLKTINQIEGKDIRQFMEKYGTGDYFLALCGNIPDNQSGLMTSDAVHTTG